MVEIDVYENRDGTLILSHDSNLKRVAGDSRSVADLTDADMQNIRLKDGSRIPTLEEVFALAKQEGIRLIVEPKLHGKEHRLYDTLVELYARYDMYEQAWVQSLSLHSLLEIRKRDPRIRIGYTIF